MEPVSDLSIDLARVEIVRSPEGQAVIQKEPPVGDVQPLNGHRPDFPEALTK
jgi:hypothetical protein